MSKLLDKLLEDPATLAKARALVAKALRSTGGRIDLAAKSMGVSRLFIYTWTRRMDINVDEYRRKPVARTPRKQLRVHAPTIPSLDREPILDEDEDFFD